MSDSKITLPEKGIDRTEILNQMDELVKQDAGFREGKMWSMVYQAADDHSEFLKQCYTRFIFANGLSPMAFPSLKKFENEVISMTVDMLRGGPEATGTITTGGTESILMAIKTYRDKFRAEKPEITKPEMVLPISAHPAFEKGAHYFDVKPIHIPLDADWRADVNEAKKAIGPNTIMLVGSAPPYPQGVVDPITELAALAAENGFGMHVDACVGGFMLPFLRELGYPVPDFDFQVEGVTSISADLHKYGYAARGASTISYSTGALRKYQFFAYTGWPGGYYASPSIPGSRPGGVIAAAWGTMMSFGREGYKKFAEIAMQTSKKLMDGVETIAGLYIIGKPDAPVFSFGTTDDKVDVWALGDAMEKRGWLLERQLTPPSLHLVVTPIHAEIADQFLLDLDQSVAEVKANPEVTKSGMAAMYGMMAQIPDQAQIDSFVLDFLDNVYKV